MVLNGNEITLKLNSRLIPWFRHVYAHLGHENQRKRYRVFLDRSNRLVLGQLNQGFSPVIDGL
jgi:hypothetical protein